MLRLLTAEDADLLCNFCRADAFGTRIAAQFSAYGDCALGDFWMQFIDDKATAAISKTEGDCVLCVVENADTDELREFFGTIGFRSLLLKDADFLPVSRGGKTMSIGGSDCHAAELFEPQSREDYRRLYSLLCLCDHAREADFDFWFADISHRMRRKLTSFYVQRDGDAFVACAAVLFETEYAKFLGAVSTHPEYRHRGLGAQTVLSAAEGNKTCNLNCKNELVPFYEKCGFSVADKWNIIEEE